MEEKKNEEKPEEQFTEPESAFPESLLEFQIETKEAEIDRVLIDLKQVEKKNKEYHQRNDLLKETQQGHIGRILKQTEEEEKKQDKKEVVTRDDVEESLKATWQYEKDKEQLLKDVQSQIEETEQRLSVKQDERDYWLEYKNVGSKTHSSKIMNLEEDIKGVKDDFHRNAEYYRNTLKAMKEENDRQVENHMKLTKEKAPENAVRYLDQNSIREIEENQWLKAEIEMYRKKISDLKASIELLEEENISLVTKLIDSKLQDLRQPRPLFLTQAAEMQGKFPKDEINEVEFSEYARKADGDDSLRSVTVPCQKIKDFAKIQSKREPQARDKELWEKPFTPTLDRLLNEDKKDFQEYLKQGPLGTRLMYVVGRTMPIHEETDDMPSRRYEDDGRSNRHITARMIRALCEEKVGET
ncbi:coiled-coil domain-containing protein 83 [Calypte anna]|uniref:coiled-coil domain-containing protein 83 n=1 Tax=Calypte anna TaxID=9244 RepID=UPI0011C3ED85|nr:coiled-coil domain-containing protein 83 [Calypte anna]